MRLKDAAKRMLLAAGLDIRFAARYDSQAMQRRLLKGVDVRTVIDAGAHQGETTSFYRTAFPSADVYAFEPFPDSATIFRTRHENDKRVHLVPAALGRAPGTAVLRVNRLAATNSLLPTDRSEHLDDPAMVETVREVEVPVMTIDGFAAERKLDRIDLLKMDVQGSEPAVLAGAAELLSRQAFDLVFTEMIFQKVYLGQGGPFETSAILDRHGYAMFGIYNLFPTRSGRMLQADAIFISSNLARRIDA